MTQYGRCGVLLLIFALRVRACSCTADWLSVKQAWQKAPVIFLGTVEFADGVPVAGSVVFTSAVRGYKEKTEAAADGSFGLTVVAGMDGELDGSTLMFEPMVESCPQFKAASQMRGPFGHMNANSISLRSDSDQKDRKLVLPSVSCKGWPPHRN